MPYVVKRIITKSGKIISEKTQPNGGVIIDSESPVVGDVIAIQVDGKEMMVEMIWGRWAAHTDIDSSHLFRLRAKEL
jgi:hypothetical protein